MKKEIIEKISDYINNLPEKELVKLANNDLIILTNDEYEELEKDRQFLSCLEAYGVDNWEGYSLAWQYFEENNE